MKIKPVNNIKIDRPMSAAPLTPALIKNKRKLIESKPAKALILGIGLTGAILISIPFCSGAYQTTTVNGNLYACQHSCSVSTMPDGNIMVSDTSGGWVARTEVSGGAIINN